MGAEGKESPSYRACTTSGHRAPAHGSMRDTPTCSAKTGAWSGVSNLVVMIGMQCPYIFYTAPQEGTCDITLCSRSRFHIHSYRLARGQGDIAPVGRHRPFFAFLKVKAALF